jgi:streptogramin lyase
VKASSILFPGRTTILSFIVAIFVTPPTTLGAQAVLPEGDGRAILETNCTACHDLSAVTAKSATRDEWMMTIQNMTSYGAVVGADQTEPLLDYLVMHFGPAAAGDTAVAENPDYEVDMDWAQLPAGMEWDGSTSSVAADGRGNVVVLVRTAPFFRVFTREGEFVRAWGEDPELFDTAHSIMFDHEGNLWATDSTGHLLHKFDPTTFELLMTLGERGETGDNASYEQFDGPNAIAIKPNGDIFISDGYQNSRIVQLTPNGEPIRIVSGEMGAGPGQLALPHGVVIDSEERIIVADSDNGRISVFDAFGRFQENWPIPSRGGMVIDENDNIYVTDVNANAVNIVSPEGEILATIGGLGRVHGVTRDTDGAIYASDALNRAVMKITPVE